ncbi:autotransporter outer membrane beta-barrel domain-containing protein, partial [Sutterella sp.]|uniref:autotransporter outer membrane beta-barrel domain-containing protein n=1 Tax=Sutterella sp. TaxID=1981025 RepID=UPI003FD82061
KSADSTLTELRVNDKTSVSKGTFSAYAEKAAFNKLDISNDGTTVQLTTIGVADGAADLTIDGLIQTTKRAALGIQATNFKLNGQIINKNSSIEVGGADAKLSSFKVVSNRENTGYSTLRIDEGGSLNVHAGAVDITGNVSTTGSKSEIAFDADNFSVNAGSGGDQHLLSASDGAKLTVAAAADGEVSINAERSAVLTSNGGTFEVTQGALDVTGIVQANEGSTIKFGSEKKPLASASFKGTDAKTGALRSNGGDFALYADDIAIDGGDGMAVESFNLGRKYDGAGNFVIQAGKTLQVKGDITSGADHGDPTSGVSKDTVLSIGAGETVQIEGDVVSFNQDESKNAVNITLSGEDSYLKGAVKNLNAKSEVVTESAGGTTLNLADGAGWIVTDKSNVKDLTIGEGGGTISTNSVEEGWIEIGEKKGDGSLTVEVADTSKLSGDTESIEKALTGIVKINAGDKSYTVEAAESNVIGEIEIGVGEDGTITSFSEKANSVTQSLEDVASFNVLSFRAQMNDLDKRMGDLRSMPASDGAWARWFGGKSEYRSSGFKNDYNAIQVGVDHRFTPEVFAGLSFTYTDNDGTLSNGTADSDTYSFGVYGGWLSPDGQFVDVTVKRHRVNTDFSIRNTAGLHEGSYGIWGTSFSVEYGWRLTCPNSGFYVEPQVEFNYGRLESVDYGTSLGSRVHQNSVTNTVGRVGAAVGYVFPEKTGSVYLKASWLHDWDGKSEGTRGDGNTYRTFSEDMGGTWGEFAMGGTYNMTNFVSAYGEVQTTTGSPIKNPWQASVGVRWSF